MTNKYAPDNKVKEILSREILDNLKHSGYEKLIRHIIFKHSDILNWQLIKELIIENCPELAKEF